MTTGWRSNLRAEDDACQTMHVFITVSPIVQLANRHEQHLYGDLHQKWGVRYFV
jgi:hypothetical protein